MPNALVDKPIYYTGHGAIRRQVGRVSSVRPGYDAAFIRIEVWDPRLRSILEGDSAGAIDVDLTL